MQLSFSALAALGVVGAVAAAGLTVAVTNAGDREEAMIQRVVDGDTIDVEMDGALQRVRLLNIDAPEDNNATGETECLGAEATAELTRLLPSGTSVQLKYDDDHYDKYDRLLAGVFVHDTLVNAEMARAGLAGSTVVGDNDRFFGAVSEAEDEARGGERGMYGTELDCTLGSVVASYESEIATASSAPLPADSASLLAAVAAASALVAAADAAEDAVHAVTWVPERISRDFAKRVTAARSTARALETRTKSALADAKDAEAAESARVAAEEAARKAAEKAAAEEEARRVAEEEARRLAEEEARRLAEEEARAVRPNSPPPSANGDDQRSGGVDDSPSTGGGDDGYTGCRAYGPDGTSLDNKGRPYTKIDCVTKQPIG